MTDLFLSVFKFRPVLFGGFFASSLLFGTSIDSTALKAAETECAQSPPAAIHWPTKAITKVNQDNYELAETQIIFADYVKKIAKTTCSEQELPRLETKAPEEG